MVRCLPRLLYASVVWRSTRRLQMCALTKKPASLTAWRGGCMLLHCQLKPTVSASGTPPPTFIMHACMQVDSVDVISYFQYVPSLPANIIALVAFFLVTCLLAWQTWRSVDGRMMWIIVLTGKLVLLSQHEHSSSQCSVPYLALCTQAALKWEATSHIWSHARPQAPTTPASTHTSQTSC